MKRPQLDVYAITRHFVDDNAWALTQEVLNTVHGAIRARDFRKLASITSLADLLCTDVSAFKCLRQIEAFFKKNADFAVEEECQKNALASFHRGERLCRITNRRLDHYFMQPRRLAPDLQRYVDRSQSYIRRILGDYRQFEESIPDLLRITSGASALHPRSMSLPFQKLGRTVACTPQCTPLLRAAYQIHGYAVRTKSVAWNRVEFVPKSWKTHRSIACEPAGNLPFQLAFDHWCKGEFRRKTRINLSSQLENQEHARRGSLDGSIATVDLSMASDTLSYNTVAWLLPQEWFEYLKRVRSPLYRLSYDGEVCRYAKFSSMGNGATFALETLIFASFLHAVGSRTGIAYGDDLTIETELYPELVRLLKFFGFVPNLDKSYAAGPFRESCGADYFEGEDITPFFIRSTDPWDKLTACHNVNGLAKISEHGKLWGYLKRFCAEGNLPLVPYNDDTLSGVLIHPYHAYDRRLIRRDPERGWHAQAKFLTRKGGKVVCRDSRALALWFLHCKSGEPDPKGYNLGAYQSSCYTTKVDKYVARWRAWVIPGAGIPDHLFGFSDYIAA